MFSNKNFTFADFSHEHFRALLKTLKAEKLKEFFSSIVNKSKMKLQNFQLLLYISFFVIKAKISP